MNIFGKILYRVEAFVDYLYLRERKYKKISEGWYTQYYSDSNSHKSSNKMIIFMTNSKLRSGGLADRLRGIVSVFDYCLKMNIEFKIFFIEPFRLSDYLIPNEYDWYISEDQISYNSKDSYPVCLIPYNEKVFNINLESHYQRYIFSKLTNKKQSQIHVYTNVFFGEKNFGHLFKVLFRPSDELSRIINIEKQKLNPSYISISTRFLELLGDFMEPDKMREPLSEINQKRLINSCIDQIKLIKLQNPKIEKILVTSDSNKFLEAVKFLDFCHVIDGKVAHIESSDTSKESNLKTFVDFLLISEAESAYLLVGKGMYTSNFSLRASQINNIPFHQVYFDY